MTKANRDSELWSLIRSYEKVALVVSMASLLPVAIRLLTGKPIGLSVFCAAVLTTISTVGVLRFRLNSTSLSALLSMINFIFWALTALMGWWISDMLASTTSHNYALEHLPLVIAIAGINFVLAFFHYYTQWPKGRAIFENLGERVDGGQISATELYSILTLQGQNERATPALLIAVGLSSTIIPLSNLLLGRSTTGLTLFALSTLFVSPTLAGVLVVRHLLQSRYLGTCDVRIVG